MIHSAVRDETDMDDRRAVSPSLFKAGKALLFRLAVNVLIG